MLVVEIVVPVVVVLSIGMVVLFTAIGRAQRQTVARVVAELEPEGIVRQSPLVGGSMRYRNYRAPGVYRGAGIRGVRRALVLTKQQLVVAGGSDMRLSHAELAKYTATARDGKLVLATDEPYRATGHFELHLRLADADEWVAALRAAGARIS